ncbi:hypothetical protein DOTSEDRAFT_70628 [Dothistroma septosporum NZE10]|uniref:Uncharacterized protein n=1 Tax=Dothistroma septosporum (strain NZE10 / CBS 128990) TaxID=675120 RepID=N1PUQ8_DOTSN|nr:hypothetical protein DOTSEDRAFT_70628 [Dothistroma septosporum NZE10]
MRCRPGRQRHKAAAPSNATMIRMGLISVAAQRVKSSLMKLCRGDWTLVSPSNMSAFERQADNVAIRGSRYAQLGSQRPSGHETSRWPFSSTGYESALFHGLYFRVDPRTSKPPLLVARREVCTTSPHEFFHAGAHKEIDAVRYGAYAKTRRTGYLLLQL